MKLKIWKSVISGEWYWHAIGRNGRILAAGEGYKRRADLVKTLHLLFGSGPHARVLQEAIDAK